MRQWTLNWLIITATITVLVLLRAAHHPLTRNEGFGVAAACLVMFLRQRLRHG